MESTSEGKVRKFFDKKAFRDMLAPVYYRHEFARRNAAVVEASDKVMKVFGMSASLVRKNGYIRCVGSKYRTLVDDMTREFYLASATTKSKMRDVLGEYASKNNLLPIQPPPHRFFPEHMGVRNEIVCKAAGDDAKLDAQPGKAIQKELVVIWSSLVQYEQLLLVEGLVDEPCFMPVVPFPQTGEDAQLPGMTPERICQLANKRLLVAFDASATRNVLDKSYETMMAHCEAMQFIHHGKTPPHKESKTQWGSYEMALQAYEHEEAYEQEKSNKKDWDVRAIDFHNLVRANKLTADSKKRQLYDAGEEYRDWLRDADSFAKHFADIGKPSDS